MHEHAHVTHEMTVRNFIDTCAFLHTLSADQILLTAQEYSGLFPSIEDFLWFQLSMVRVARPGEGGGSPGAPCAGFPVEFYTLEALQHYLQQFPPSHYSRNGAHPHNDDTQADRRSDIRERPQCKWARVVMPRHRERWLCLHVFEVYSVCVSDTIGLAAMP